ncbi:MAG: hypothetical protein HZB15_16275, partial [Actinobacteria bacterium]|nr:hypothetical protein [Actinomycetota bacterium]
MAEPDRLPRDVYVRRRLMAGAVAAVLLLGGAAAAVELRDDGPSTPDGGPATTLESQATLPAEALPPL